MAHANFFSLEALELFHACITLGMGILSACHDEIQRDIAPASKKRSDIPVGYCLCGCGPTAGVKVFDLNGALQALEEDAQIYRLYPAVISECFAPYSDAPKEIWSEPEDRRASNAHHACLLSMLNFLILLDQSGARKHFDGLSKNQSCSGYDPTFFPGIPLSLRQYNRAIKSLRAAPSFGDFAQRISPWLTLEMAKAKATLPEVKNGLRLHVDDVDNFKNARAVKKAEIAAFLASGFLRKSEDAVQHALEEILEVPNHRKDWGGEGNDLYTANVTVNGVRRATAFLLKGPGIGKNKTMTISDCGKNGDQLVRLFTAPADLFVVQYVGPIADSVISDVEGKAVEKRAQGKNAQFLIIDGQDTARLLYAYGKLGHTGSEGSPVGRYARYRKNAVAGR
jgi:hypothetical protein